jgi:hypothetical protein
LIGFASVVTYGIQQTVSPLFAQMAIERAPTLLILLAVVLFVPCGRIVERFSTKGFYQDRWYVRTPMRRLLAFGICFSLAQFLYLEYGVAAVLGSQILQKGNNTYAVLYLSSFLLYFLGYGFHDLPFSRWQLFRSDRSANA